MTDDEIEALAKKHICPHHDRLEAILPNRVPYQQTEQFRRVKALIADVLSKLRAPVADERAAFSRAEISFPLTIPETRVYLAGPMTGHENHNFPAFHAAAERLRGSGLEVVNPADHGLVSGLGWSDYMRWDLVKLAGCHAVYVLPGWEKSKGASLEISIARALGMPVFTVDGAALASAPVAGEAVAWMHAEDPARVISALQKATSERDGGAYASSLRPYNIALGRLAAPQVSEAEQAIIAAFLERSGQWLTNDVITKAARNAALEEAAVACKETSMMNVDSYCGATASMCADRIRALKSQSAALSAQPGAQKEQSDA